MTTHTNEEARLLQRKVRTATVTLVTIFVCFLAYAFIDVAVSGVPQVREKSKTSVPAERIPSFIPLELTQERVQ